MSAQHSSDAAFASRFVCAGCGFAHAPQEPLPLTCPRAGSDDVEHALERELDLSATAFPAGDDEPNPFVRFRALLHSWRFARRAGRSDEEWVALARTLDGAVAAAAGRGSRVTPYTSVPALAEALGVAAAYVKDETQGVSGSHKGRHLFGFALHLAALGDAGRPDAELAIASCGNAALAAAVVARALRRRLVAFVPPDAPAATLARLAKLGARVETCARGSGAPPGDPCVRAFRAAVADGALPFCVQGSANALVLEGGSTLAWELAAQHAALGEPPLDRVLVQVGGGALAASTAAGLADAARLAALERLPRIDAVQSEGCAPLDRAWRRVRGHAGGLAAGLADAARHRSRFMEPWATTPRGAASGILDDETYDWLLVLRGLAASGGESVVATEQDVLAAHRLGREATGLDVSATGTAGLAGALRLAAQGRLRADERIALLFTGVER